MKFREFYEFSRRTLVGEDFRMGTPAMKRLVMTWNAMALIHPDKVEDFMVNSLSPGTNRIVETKSIENSKKNREMYLGKTSDAESKAPIDNIAKNKEPDAPKPFPKKTNTDTKKKVAPKSKAG